MSKQKSLMKTEKPSCDKGNADSFLPQEAHAAQIDRFAKKARSAAPAPRCCVTSSDEMTTASLAPGAENLVSLMESCGTVDMAFAERLLKDLVGACCHAHDGDEQSDINAALAALTGLAPANEAEGMLAAQMVATHRAGMQMLGQAMRPQSLATAQWQSGFAVKLLRTFTQQMEALQRYRGKGQQKMLVEHVHVHAGGQAIVGPVSGRGSVNEKKEEQPHAK